MRFNEEERDKLYRGKRPEAIVLFCTNCKRKMVLETVYFGVPHTDSRAISCWDCITDEQMNILKEMQPHLFENGD